ncbi:MAG: hypothetical protein AABZ47_08240 [Planctomycetota bacterium]
MRFCTFKTCIGLIAPIVFTGCVARSKYEPWSPKPRVEWSDIASVDLPPVQNEYRLLVSLPTKGLFPASLAVSRVSVQEKPTEPNPRQPMLVTDPRNEFLRWNSSFDNLMAVSEVFPIANRTLGGGQAEPEQILAAFRALHARLGLIYAVNEANEAQTEMIAVLYDLHGDRPLACLHAEETSLVPREAASKDRKADLWIVDSRALVRARLEKQLHTCLRELILQDEPPELEDKSNWTPVLPTRPVEWPPRQSPPGP